MNYFDLHCDTPYECYVKNKNFSDASLAVNSAAARDFGRWYQCFAVWIKDDMHNPLEFYRSVISDFKRKISDSNVNNMVPFFAVEGGALIESTDTLKELYYDGVRYLTLTWNGKNRIASGVGTKGGVTDFGCRVIEELNRLHIACDLSHANQESYFDALQIADFPIVTHSCCHSLFSHPRNITDRQITALADKDGIMGLCFYPEFLGGGNVFDAVYGNIIHLLSLGAEDNIAIGSDFDGAEMNTALDSARCIPTLYAFLEEKGIQKNILEKLFFENAYKFFLKL